MREVSVQTVGLLIDSVQRHALDPWDLFDGLPVSPATIHTRGARLDWDVWVEMLARVDRRVGGPAAMERLFVAGAGERTGHPFVRVAQSFLSVAGTYDLFGRWGLSRTLQVVRGRYRPAGAQRATFVVDVDPGVAGTSPMMHYIVGVLRNLPTLQGLAPAEVTITQVSAHHAEYLVRLPPEASLYARVRRRLDAALGSSATLDELEAQAQEIGDQNRELWRRVGELERTGAKLREREAWLELALEAGELGLFTYDPATREVTGSAGVGRICGVDVGAPDLLERLRGRVHADDRELVRTAFLTAASGAAAVDVTFRLLRTDGKQLWARLRGRLEPRPEGGGSLIYGVLTDVTEQREMETKLRQADRMIAAGTLAAGVAHEINNPLTYVLGAAELMREELARGRPAALGENLADVFDGLGRIRDVVSDLRAFARPEAESVAPMPIEQVVGAAARLVAPSVRHRAALAITHGAPSACARINPSRLGQVLTNLVLNAAQAMPARPVSENLIRVRTDATDETIVIEVHDNGEGIAAEHLPRLFDPFFTTKEAGVGTGLGLAVSHNLVGAHGGRIEVESELGRGSVFRVHLPRAAEVAATEAGPAPRAAPGKLRVLVVDDEPLLRKTLGQQLEDAGFDVLLAAGVRDAVGVLAREAVDVVLTDVTMPDGSAESLCDALRELPGAAAARVVLMTGGAVTPAARGFLATSGLRVLEKPFSISAVIAELRGSGR